MSKYIMRLDDACEKMDTEKWERMEKLLDKYKIRPIVGVIPHCEDSMMDKYEIDRKFWDKVDLWRRKNWTIAMHGYNHVYSTACGGINPVNKRSEFAGEAIEVQRKKIADGVAEMRKHGIEPAVFFAPSHTFDENTLTALKEESNIRIISDTIAFDRYEKYSFTFVPQQSGRVRKLPFQTVTFCYHPNTMKENEFVVLEKFLKNYVNKFIYFPLNDTERKFGLFDMLLKKAYFIRK